LLIEGQITQLSWKKNYPSTHAKKEIIPLNFAFSTSPDSLIGASWKIIILVQYTFYSIKSVIPQVSPHIIIRSDVWLVIRLIYTSICSIVESKVCSTMHHLGILKNHKKKKGNAITCTQILQQQEKV
jgi:hypothetical protein